MLQRLGRRYYYKVLGLFLAAALVPVLTLSWILTSMAAAAFERATAEGGRATAAAFAERLDSLVGRVREALDELAAAPTILEVISASDIPETSARSEAQRLLARPSPRQGGDFSVAVTGMQRGRLFASRDPAPEWDPSVYGAWGILRRASDARGDVALMSRRRVSADGETNVLVAGRAILDKNERVLGFVLAEIRRSALVRAARPGREFLAADAEVLDASGLVAFSLADPSREGQFFDELPSTTPTQTLVFTARAGKLEARAILPSGLLAELGDAMSVASLAGAAACALAAALLALLASRIVTGPVLSLSASMGRIESGDLSARVKPGSDDEIGRLGRSFNAMAERLNGLVAAAVEDQELLRKAELAALAAQMNPHFLYNSLNSLRSLAKLGRCGEIVETASRLGKLLRASVENRSGISTVEAALGLVRDYLAVERIRFGDRISFREDIDPALLPCSIPPLVLEPLAENALTHGLELKSGPGSLLIAGRIEDADAVILFEDDGPGCPPKLLAELARLLATGETPSDPRHVGLLNTNRRLRLRYGPGYGLSVGTRRDGASGFRAELRFPFAAEG